MGRESMEKCILKNHIEGKRMGYWSSYRRLNIKRAKGQAERCWGGAELGEVDRGWN